MRLNHLRIQNCRVISAAELPLHPNFNVLVGENASGKSSCLEALYILSRGRSFRTQNIADVVQHGQQRLLVAGEVQNQETQAEYPIGIEKGVSDTKIRINHETIYKQSDLARHLPFTVIHPETVDLISGRPEQRRNLLDWVAFYTDQEFQDIWRQHKRIVAQRNVCLRDDSQTFALSHWTAQLVKLQQPLFQHRTNALKALRKSISALSNKVPILSALKLSLSSGLPNHVDMKNVPSVMAYFERNMHLEKRQGATLFGAHRADLNIQLEGHSAAQTASRGQLKLLGTALLLAQSLSITTSPEKTGMIAVDDLSSELDSENQSLLFHALSHFGHQLIITGTNPPSSDLLPSDHQLFHVKQGEVVVA